MQFSAVQCNAVQCSAVQYSAVQCSAVQCSAGYCRAVKCSALTFSEVHYSAVPRVTLKRDLVSWDYEVLQHNLFIRAPGVAIVKLQEWLKTWPYYSVRGAGWNEQAFWGKSKKQETYTILYTIMTSTSISWFSLILIFSAWGTPNKKVCCRPKT